MLLNLINQFYQMVKMQYNGKRLLKIVFKEHLLDYIIYKEKLNKINKVKLYRKLLVNKKWDKVIKWNIRKLEV